MDRWQNIHHYNNYEEANYKSTIWKLNSYYMQNPFFEPHLFVLDQTIMCWLTKFTLFV